MLVSVSCLQPIYLLQSLLISTWSPNFFDLLRLCRSQSKKKTATGAVFPSLKSSHSALQTLLLASPIDRPQSHFHIPCRWPAPLVGGSLLPIDKPLLSLPSARSTTSHRLYARILAHTAPSALSALGRSPGWSPTGLDSRKCTWRRIVSRSRFGRLGVVEFAMLLSLPRPLFPTGGGLVASGRCAFEVCRFWHRCGVGRNVVFFHSSLNSRFSVLNGGC